MQGVNLKLGLGQKADPPHWGNSYSDSKHSKETNVPGMDGQVGPNMKGLTGHCKDYGLIA